MSYDQPSLISFFSFFYVGPPKEDINQSKSDSIKVDTPPNQNQFIISNSDM